MNPVAVVFMAGLLLFTGILLFRSQRYLARQRRQSRPSFHPSESEPREPKHSLVGSAEFSRWEVRMHDTARELAAELDSKMSALEQLIREADRAAARLEQSLAAAPQSVESPGVTRAEPASQADGLRSSSRAGLPLEDEAPGADVAPASGGDKRRYDEIYMLSDYGYPVAEIARRAGVPIGEIELILSLRNNR